MENFTNNTNNGQGFAISSLVIGIFAILFSIIPCVGTVAIFIGIVAVILGTIALSKSEISDTPKGLSIVGISLGGLAIVIAILWIVFVVGSKTAIKDKFENAFDWVEQLEDMEIDIDDDDFKNMESLEELEQALDELEGIIDDVNEEVDSVLEEVHHETKKVIKEAQNEIDEAKKEF